MYEFEASGVYGAGQNIGFLQIWRKIAPCDLRVTHLESAPAPDYDKRQQEYKRAKDYCDSPLPPGLNHCATLPNQIEHAKRCIELYQEWDNKWQPGKHDEKIETSKTRLQKLKDEHRRNCTQK